MKTRIEFATDGDGRDQAMYYVISGENLDAAAHGFFSKNIPYKSVKWAFKYARKHANSSHYGLEVVNNSGRLVDEDGYEINGEE